MPPTPVARALKGLDERRVVVTLDLEGQREVAAEVAIPAFSPGPCSTAGPSVGSSPQEVCASACRRQCSDQRAEKRPSSVKEGSRPRAPDDAVVTSPVRPEPRARSSVTLRLGPGHPVSTPGAFCLLPLEEPSHPRPGLPRSEWKINRPSVPPMAFSPCALRVGHQAEDGPPFVDETAMLSSEHWDWRPW